MIWGRVTSTLTGRRLVLTMLGCGLAVTSGCTPANGDGSQNTNAGDGNSNTSHNANDNVSVGAMLPSWSRVFDASYTGGLTGIWGSSQEDIFVVGGQLGRAEVYHFDGQVWQAMDIPTVPLLSAVHGFSHDDVYAVGEGGGVIHFDGVSWTALPSGTTQTLWGVWGANPDDIWIVGGDLEDNHASPVILHYDGQAFAQAPPPQNDRFATALFDVVGLGGRVFAVGSLGLIVELDTESGEWIQVFAGELANQDFFSICGLGDDQLVAVGGSDASGARAARFDGESWTTTEISGLGRLNAVEWYDDQTLLVGGTNGLMAAVNPVSGDLAAEVTDTSDTIRGLWKCPSGVTMTVGGFFVGQSTGLVLVRNSHAGQVEPGEAVIQLDANEDGRPDAPLQVDGTAPDSDRPVNENDNQSPTTPPEPIDLGIIRHGVFQPVEFGDSVPFYSEVQGGGLFINPVVRVSTFPPDAGENLVTISHVLTLREDGSVLGSSEGGLAILSHVLGFEDVFDVLRHYPLSSPLTSEQLDGELVDFTVTLEYAGTLDSPAVPPLVETVSRSFLLSAEVGDLDN